MRLQRDNDIVLWSEVGRLVRRRYPLDFLLVLENHLEALSVDCFKMGPARNQ